MTLWEGLKAVGALLGLLCVVAILGVLVAAGRPRLLSYWFR